MKPLSECLERVRGKSPQEFVNEHPHSVLIGLGVLPGELQKNPAKASGTLYLNLSPDNAASSGADDALVNKVFDIRKMVSQTAPERIEVGGTEESDVMVPDHTVSRNHAFFLISGDMHLLVDGGSTNGTFINGARAKAHQPQEVKSGDIITFGRYSFTFYDPMAFAKLLAVQAMMRPRGRSRTPHIDGGPRRPPGSRVVARTPRRPVPREGVVDPFLGPPREGRFTTPEDVRRAVAITDPRRAFPPVWEQPAATQNLGDQPTEPIPVAKRAGAKLQDKPAPEMAATPQVPHSMQRTQEPVGISVGRESLDEGSPFADPRRTGGNLPRVDGMSGAARPRSGPARAAKGASRSVAGQSVPPSAQSLPPRVQKIQRGAPAGRGGAAEGGGPSTEQGGAPAEGAGHLPARQGGGLKGFWAKVVGVMRWLLGIQ